MPTHAGFYGVTRVYFSGGKRRGWKWRSNSNNHRVVASCANEVFTRPRDARLAALKFGPSGFKVVVDKPKRAGS